MEAKQAAVQRIRMQPVGFISVHGSMTLFDPVNNTFKVTFDIPVSGVTDFTFHRVKSPVTGHMIITEGQLNLTWEIVGL